MTDKPGEITVEQVLRAMAAMPDGPNDAPLKYYASGEADAEWARRNYPGMEIVVKPRIPR